MKNKVEHIAKQWGYNPTSIKAVPHHSGYTFIDRKTGENYYTIPDKGIIVNTENFKKVDAEND